MSETGGPSFKPTGARLSPPTPNVKSIDDKFRDVAKLYEKQFMREMVKAMRSTVQESGLLKVNTGEKIFREQLDEQYVDKWGARGGMGLADLIYNQLVERYGAQMGLKAPITKPQGPIPVDAKSNYQGPIRVASPNPKETVLRFDRDEGGTDKISAPWSGTLLDKKLVADGTHLLEVAHDNGLTGRLVFRGNPERLELGQSLQEGETVGLLSPEAKSFFWTVSE